MRLVSRFFRRGYAFLLGVTLLFSGGQAVHAEVTNATFDHYTVALSWLPGFCNVSQACERGQSHHVVIGLHGIWPSEPQSFITAGVPEKLWTKRGCRSLARATWGGSAPLSEQTRRDYKAAAADTGRDLIGHEVDKHLACVSVDPDATIRVGLKVRNDFDATSPAEWLKAHLNQYVSRREFFKVVKALWPGVPRGALILRCRPDRDRRSTLVALELGLDADAITTFPNENSFAKVAGRRSSCPAKFWLPDWPK